MAWFAPLYDALMYSSEQLAFGPLRRELLRGLSGRALEIGAGTGANWPYYPEALSEIVLSEPDPDMRARLEGKVGARAVVTDWPAEALGAPDGSFDVVISTLVCCSVRDPLAALTEVRRVLRPGGALLFLEHVGGSGLRRAAQRACEPLWRPVAGNCHLCRDTASTIRAAGLPIEGLTEHYPRAVPALLWPIVTGLARKPL